ncbi:phosphoenolpyruvate--protein phosphotransferase [Planctomycetota bacterium]
MLEHKFQCPLPRGIHARPASHLQSVAKRYRSKIRLENLRNGKIANVRSIFSLVGAEIRSEDNCRLHVSGPDQEPALNDLRCFIEKEFSGCDSSPDEPVRRSGQVTLPQSLLAAHPCYVVGRGAVAGLAVANLRVVCTPALPDRLDMQKGNCKVECQRFERACSALAQQLLSRIQSADTLDEHDVLQAHYGLVTDEEFIELVRDRIQGKDFAAGEAVLAVVRSYREQFQASENEITRDKVLDLDDLCRCLLVHMYGFKPLGSRTIKLVDSSILAAPSLTPGEFLELDKNKLRGLVLSDAGTTSHTVILARAYGIPTLTGMDFTAIQPHAGEHVLLDGHLGLLILSPDQMVQAYYDLETKKQALLQQKIARQAHQPAYSCDGVLLEVSANITCAEEACPAFDAGAMGIGLFRTEMLYMDRERPPTEEEQVQAYREVLEAAGSRRVILRTFDVGADKCPPYMDLRCDGDIDLDFRGVPLYQRHEALFRRQLRAMLRAAPAGNAWIMIPMVSSPEEVFWVQSIKAKVEDELRDEGWDFEHSTTLGAMIETPVAAQAIEQLCDHLDFFSIGTNDLAQYLLAVDRTHGFWPYLRSDHKPELIGLLQQVIRAIRARGKWVGLCGEMATDPTNIPLWLGFGLNGISVPGSMIARVKNAITAVSASDARSKMDDVVACQSAEAVTQKLQSIGQRTPPVLPIIDSSMILLGVTVSLKEFILKALADHLFIHDRVQDSIVFENSLWEREKTYSTGLGHGMAIPHCVSPSVTANTIAVMRLAQPVTWGSLDEKPVSTVILLAHSQNKEEEHLPVFARLARLLMRKAFRDVLQGDSSPEHLAEYLKQELNLDRSFCPFE